MLLGSLTPVAELYTTLYNSRQHARFAIDSIG